MILTARTRETIRAALLARLAARFASGLAPLDVREPGDAWQMTDALAVLLSALEGQAAGAASQILPDRATGTWLNAHGDVAGLSRQNGENDADYQTRLLAWWEYRLPAGSPADLVAVCEETDACVEAYVYPNESGDTRGRCVAVAAGPAQGQSATNTRLLSGAQLTQITDYIDGAVDIHGAAVADGEQLRPVCAQMLAGGNVRIVNATYTGNDVTLAIANDATHPWPWLGSHAILASTAVTWEVAGDYTALTLLAWLIPVGPAARGEFVRAVPFSAVYDFWTNRTTFEVAVGVLPDVPWLTVAYPAPPNWESVRDAVFAVFDAITPGDSAPPSRYPTPSATRPALLYVGALYNAALNADGVVNVVITLPAVTVTPAEQQHLTLALLTVTKL